MKKKQLILVGSYPPPYGGVNVHIQRLHQLASEYYDTKVVDLYGREEKIDDKQFLYRCGNLRPFNLTKAIGYLNKNYADIVHFHVSALGNFTFAGYPMLYSLNSRTKKIITIHSGSFVKYYERSSFLRKLLLWNIIKMFNHVIVVNKEGYVLLKNLEVPLNKISIIPAFLTPFAKPSSVIQATIKSLKQKTEKVLLVSGSGFKHYGFHIVLDALDIYKEQRKNLGVVFTFYNKYDKNYVAEIEKRVENSFNYAIFRDLNPNDFSYLLSLVDIFVRPTDRDGDAVALREAAYFGKQVIASDCIKRPSNVILFKTMKAESLKRAIDQAIENPEEGLAQINVDANKDKILKLYEKATTEETE